ncbi:MAG: UDP-N-acetylenolpyruvoylglucosamine reductase [Ectothiorhodospiraceae bacterium]|nr:UDP-N-acetylenolpyruvoylglucosamine reductase [Ectothiorhodospiraceae bacterium]
MRTGGPVDILVDVGSISDLNILMRELNWESTRYLILGRGSNVLIPDNGIRGIVIRLEGEFTQLLSDGDILYAGAGARISNLVSYAIRRGYSGYERLAGIPGAVGGAVIMNAGAHGAEISDNVISVETFTREGLRAYSKEECQFEYRTSNLQGQIVLRAIFKCEAGDTNKMRGTRSEILAKRNASQPVQWPNSGSIFKNPKSGYAAKYLEEAGLKGYKVGGAEISNKHANFIINTGSARTQDVIELIKHARRTVSDKYGVLLEPEVKYLGSKGEIVEGEV